MQNSEAVRLINKFFPESKPFVTYYRGVTFDGIYETMQLCGMLADYSCDPYADPSGPDLGFSKTGGFGDEESEIFKKLLLHTGFAPKGRVVVIPDALGINLPTKDYYWPFVCDINMVAIRLNEFPICFFEVNVDCAFVFESGECIMVNHDHKIYWAKSRKVCQ